MWTLFFILALTPVLVFGELAAQRWLFNNDAQKHDREWEVYQQRYD